MDCVVNALVLVSDATARLVNLVIRSHTLVLATDQRSRLTARHWSPSTNWPERKAGRFARIAMSSSTRWTDVTKSCKSFQLISVSDLELTGLVSDVHAARTFAIPVDDSTAWTGSMTKVVAL